MVTSYLPFIVNKAVNAREFDGYSEAWSKIRFPAKSIKELMRLVEEDEEHKKSERKSAPSLD